jgi:hypothetical protein
MAAGLTPRAPYAPVAKHGGVDGALHFAAGLGGCASPAVELPELTNLHTFEPGYMPFFSGGREPQGVPHSRRLPLTAPAGGRHVLLPVTTTMQRSELGRTS